MAPWVTRGDFGTAFLLVPAGNPGYRGYRENKLVKGYMGNARKAVREGLQEVRA